MFRLRCACSAVITAVAVLSLAAWAGASPQPGSSNKAQPAARRLSHARIVRISLAQEAQINVQDGQGWKTAMPNMPVTQGDMLRTGASGRAEVEFEDGSAVRLIPNSQVVFQQLALTARGVRLNGVAVTSGTAFFTLHPKDSQAFRAIFPEGVATVPDKKAEFQITVDGQQARVQMLSGRAEIAAAGQPYSLKKGDLLTLNEQAPAELAKAKADTQWDHWNRARDQVMEADTRSISGWHGDAFYGLGELSSYGTWQGGMWYPAGMGMGWSPYMNGHWFYDPEFGYMWNSFYPWGWAPFHYGMWMETPMGWAWSPQGGMFFEPYPMATDAGGVAMALPPRPVAPATALHRNLTTAGITTVHSNGISAPARILGTRQWNAMQARIAASGQAREQLRAAQRSGRFNSAQLNALRRANQTQQHQWQRAREAMWMRQQGRYNARPARWNPPAPVAREGMPAPAAERSEPMARPPMPGIPSGVPMGGAARGEPVIRH